MEHTYSETFYKYIEGGARDSAKTFAALITKWFPVTSVLDVGCGRGVWLSEWQNAGVFDVLGIDGPYVNQDNLAIPQDLFRSRDLIAGFDLARQFDLVQSLEVAEHLPEASARGFVESLTRHGDIILFSAAVPGQGGEHHVNEQPLQYWRDLFGEFGYTAFDAIRPHVAADRQVEPWYRFNSIIYANASGQRRLPSYVLERRVEKDHALRNGGDLKWNVRRKALQLLPQPAVTWLAMQNARAKATQAARI
jgi:SAM-dependent methyltransferase